MWHWGGGHGRALSAALPALTVQVASSENSQGLTKKPGPSSWKARTCSLFPRSCMALGSCDFREWLKAMRFGVAESTAGDSE